jgi:hypothetical protein
VIGERAAIPVGATVLSGAARCPDATVRIHSTLHGHPHDVLSADPQSTSDPMATIGEPPSISIAAVTLRPGFRREGGSGVGHRVRRKGVRDEPV